MLHAPLQLFQDSTSHRQLSYTIHLSALYGALRMTPVAHTDVYLQCFIYNFSATQWENVCWICYPHQDRQAKMVLASIAIFQ